MHQIKPYRTAETFCGKSTKRAQATMIHYGASCRKCREGYMRYCIAKMRRISQGYSGREGERCLG